MQLNQKQYIIKGMVYGMGLHLVNYKSANGLAPKYMKGHPLRINYILQLVTIEKCIFKAVPIVVLRYLQSAKF